MRTCNYSTLVSVIALLVRDPAAYFVPALVRVVTLRYNRSPVLGINYLEIELICPQHGSEVLKGF